MVDLSKVTQGAQALDPRVFIYSADGIGKTKFAAGAPDPFFIDVNRGSIAYSVRRVMPDNWDEVIEWLSAVENDQVKCRTLVIDSITDLESMSYSTFFQGTTIDEYKGGFKRGDTLAQMKWRELLAQIERIWLKGKIIVLVGHMRVKRFEDPMVIGGYERFEISARPELAGLLRQWCDYVLFAKEDVVLQGGKNKSEKSIAITTNIRHIYTRRTPAYDAKSRGTTLFPDKLLLSWDEFYAAFKADAKRVVETKGEIESMLAELGDQAYAERVREYVRVNPEKVVEVRNRVASKLADKSAKEQELITVKTPVVVDGNASGPAVQTGSAENPARPQSA